MNRPALILLSFLLVGLHSGPAWPDAGDDELVIAPGDTVVLDPPAPGLVLEAAIGSGPLLPTDGRLAAPAEGAHWLAVASRDTAANRSDVRWIRLLVDATPPSIEARVEPPLIADAAGRLWAAPPSELVATASDAPAGVAELVVEVDGQAHRSDDVTLRAPLPDSGTAEVVVRSVDNVANRAPAHALTVAVDGTPPRGTIRIEGPHVAADGGPVLGPTARLALDLGDPESGVASWQAEADGRTIESSAWEGAWSAGPHETAVRARDRVGNEAEVGRLAFVVDDRGPEIDWRITSASVSLDDGRTVYRPPVTMSVVATDAPAGVASLVRGSGRGEVVDGPFAIDGDRLRLAAKDRVDNASEVIATWSIDRQPPSLLVRAPNGESVEPGGTLSASRGANLVVEAADDLAGVDTVTYVLNNREVPGSRDPRPVTGAITMPTGGAFLLEVTARDRLGNERVGTWMINAAWWEAP